MNAAVQAMMTLLGARVAAIVDIESGQCLAQAGSGSEDVLTNAALVNARMLRSEMHMVQDQYHESIEDVLITLNHQYHLIRLIGNQGRKPSMFLYFILQRDIANMAMARRKMAEVEKELVGTDANFQQLEIARQRTLGFDNGDNKVHGTTNVWQKSDSGMEIAEEYLPPFMREDVAMKLLGIDPDEIQPVFGSNDEPS